jgi:hypothetical protein
LKNYWTGMNVRNAKKRTGIPFAGRVLSKIAILGSVKFAGNARIGVSGIVEIAIDVLTEPRCRVNIAEITKKMTQMTNFLTRLWNLRLDGRSFQKVEVDGIPVVK